MGATAMRGRVVVGVLKDASDRVYIVCDARDTFKVAIGTSRDCCGAKPPHLLVIIEEMTRK